MKKSTIALLAVAATTAIACGASPPEQATSAPTPAADTTTQKNAPKTPAKPATFGDGTYLVGDDLPAGTYRSAGAAEGMFQLCSWSIKASDEQSARIVDIGTAGELTDRQRVKLKAGQEFETNGCAPWTRAAG